MELILRAGAMVYSSGGMPRRIHQTETLERRLMAVAAEKRLPLSVRMASGRPWARTARLKRLGVRKQS